MANDTLAVLDDKQINALSSLLIIPITYLGFDGLGLAQDQAALIDYLKTTKLAFNFR